MRKERVQNRTPLRMVVGVVGSGGMSDTIKRSCRGAVSASA